MSTQILIKRSSVASAVPTTSDIATGELAVNTVDKRIFTNNNGTIVELGTYPSTQAVAGNATVGGTLGVTGATTLSSGSVTGNFSVAGTLTVASPVNSTDAASKGYVDAQVSAVIDAAPAALDTLNELAAALNDDANFATTVTNALNTKLNKAGDTMTGNLVMGANKVTSTATPTAADDLTRKGYVDGLYQSTVDAEVSAANALASEQAAATSASNAATSASASATSASAASTSATNAASSATAAASSATSSANSATASATSATQSAASATQAQALVDSIESFYLGAEASAPTVDDNGDPLQAGDWYFNTTDNTTYIYNGSSWQSVSPDLVSDLTPQLGGNLDTNGNDVLFGDNDKAIFGAGSDLQIYHNGSHSIINDVGTGELKLQGTNVRLQSASGGENYLTADLNGAVRVYYDDAQKLQTTSTGIDVTGTAIMDGLTVDGDVSLSSSGGSVLTLGDTTASAIGGETIGQLKFLSADNSAGNTPAIIQGTGSDAFGRVDLDFFTGAGTAVQRMKIDKSGDISFYEDTGTTAKFFWDASAESLGIGTSSPSDELEIASALPVIRLTDTDTSAYGRIALTDGDLIFQSDEGNTAASSNMRFEVDGSEAMRINSAGNVGIGTSSPSGKLDVVGTIKSTSSVTMNDSGGLINEDDTTNSISLSADPGNSGANSLIQFKIDATERMRVDSSGNLLVGKTAVDTASEGVVLANQSYFTRTGGNTALFNRNTTDGNIIAFAKDGTTVGSIGVASGVRPYFTRPSVGGLTIGSAQIMPTTDTGSNSDGILTLGASGTRFKDLYLSGGVYLGGTGAANHLDSYEEGTWTPTVAGDATGVINGSEAGRYVKIGNVVHVQCQFQVTTNFTSNSIGGLPFQPAIGSALSTQYGLNPVASAVTGSFIMCRLNDNLTTVQFVQTDNQTNHAPSTTGLVYRLCFTYETTA